jgi:phosphoglycerate dehydrogenase-like enzyme
MPAVGADLLRDYLQIKNEITVIPDPSSATDHLDVFEAADVIVGGPITETIARQSRRLKLFHVFRGGTGGLGLEWLPPQVLIANTYHHGAGIAEFVLMAMLMLPRQTCYYDRELRQGKWAGGK